MRPLYFVADPHIHNHAAFGGEMVGGLNDRCRLAVAALRQAGSLTLQVNGVLVVLGDVFDTAKPAPPVIRAVQEALPNHSTVILAGNHDRASEAPGDHSLGPLRPMAQVVEKPSVIGLDDAPVLWCVPYRTGNALEWFPADVAQLAERDARAPFQLEKRPRILCFHLGIIDGKTPPFLRDARDAIPFEIVQGLVERYNLAGAFAGNWHGREVFQTDPPIVQVGTLCPTGFDNPGLDALGAVTVYPSNLDAHSIPGPRFLKGRGQLGLAAVQKEISLSLEYGHALFVRLIATTPDEHACFKEAIDSMLDASYSPPLIRGGEALLDDVEAEVMAARAAKQASRADTLAEALAAYVRGMELPEGVTTGEVLERAQRFLKG